MYKHSNYALQISCYVVKSVIISDPTVFTVERAGLPITLTCQVSGDPNHYWVGWMHQNTMIKGDGNSHSLSDSRSVMSMSPNTTSYHLKVHSVKNPGKYSCLVFSIEGKQLDNVTHQVSIKGILMLISFCFSYILYKYFI